MKTLKLFKFPVIALLLTGFMLNTATAQEKQTDKVEDATGVLRDFGKMKESIPRELLVNTQGIIIIPKLINAGLVIGGKRGKGIAMVREADGKWSNPVFVTLTGGSFGFQAGVQSVDLVLVFKSAKTLHRIGTGSFTLGGDISATAGPVGRSSSANTDYKLEAEVYSYSRSRGLFAGISLNGAKLDIDAKADDAFYGASYTARTLFAGTDKTSAPEVKELKETLKGLYQ